MSSTRSELQEVQKKVRLYLSVNRFDAAEKLLKATLSEYGPLANIHNLLGVTYHRQSRFAESIREFNSALSANPEFVESALNLAATLCDLSQYDEAQKIFQHLSEKVTSRRKQPSLVLGRLANQHAENGLAYEESGMVAEAITEYRKALSLYERMPDVKLSLAKLYLQSGQGDKAKTELEDLLKTMPDHTEAHNWIGIIYYKLGQRDLARHHWEKAQQSAPSNLTTRAYIKMSNEWQRF
jgi:tetratricopeptide (TPR) repeat protein